MLKQERSIRVVNSRRREFYFYVVGILDACIGATAKVCPPKQSYVRTVYRHLRCVKCRELRSIIRKLCEGVLMYVCCKRIEECERVMAR